MTEVVTYHPAFPTRLCIACASWTWHFEQRWQYGLSPLRVDVGFLLQIGSDTPQPKLRQRSSLKDFCALCRLVDHFCRKAGVQDDEQLDRATILSVWSSDSNHRVANSTVIRPLLGLCVGLEGIKYEDLVRSYPQLGQYLPITIGQ